MSAATSRPWVAYVVPFAVPWGQAGSRRVMGISRSIAATGRDVVLLALPTDGQRAGDTSVLHTDPSGATISVVARPSLAHGSARRQWQHHVTGAADALAAVDALRPTRPSHVVLYGTTATALAQTLRWGRSRRVRVVVDVVERYAPQQFSGGRLAPGYLSATAGFGLLAQRADGLIVISGHLERHFSCRVTDVLRVPPTLDVRAVEPGPGHCDPVLGYFGSPGGKDLLGVVVRAFTLARSRAGGEGLRLVVAGPGTQEALGPEEAEGVTALGRLPQKEVASVVGGLSATVLARPRERYAEAGYPTKVVESLAVGTPVVCNLTSDLGESVREGETGWVAEDASVDALADAISRVAASSPDERLTMRRAARVEALDRFDVGAYVAPLDDFLTRLCSGSR